MCFFAPGTKLSMMFNKSDPDSSHIYERQENEYSSQPTIVMNGNGFHQPMSYSSDA